VHCDYHVSSLLHIYKLLLKTLHGLDKQQADKTGKDLYNCLNDKNDSVEMYKLCQGHAVDNGYLQAYHELKSVFEKIIRTAYDQCFYTIVDWLMKFQTSERQHAEKVLATAIEKQTQEKQESDMYDL